MGILKGGERRGGGGGKEGGASMRSFSFYVA